MFAEQRMRHQVSYSADGIYNKDFHLRFNATLKGGVMVDYDMTLR